jgi:hypothetical protein
VSTASLLYDQMLAIDAWRCSECGGTTYDEHKFEVPRFCSRCGQKFNEHDYKDKLKEKETK